MENVLLQLLQGISSGGLKLVDLTQTLSSEFPTLQLPPEFGQVLPFKQENISRYDENGPGWYWNNFSCGEHTGTHFDAPAHWVTGKDIPNNTVDKIDPKSFIAPAVVVDCSAQVEANNDWLLTVEHLEKWEAKHGRIPAGILKNLSSRHHRLVAMMTGGDL